MRALAATALILIAACSQPSGHTASPSAPAPSPTTAVSICRLPVWWADPAPSTQVHAAFVSVPDGAVTEAGILTLLPQTYGATYDSVSHKWLRVDRQLLSPDGTSYAYWAADPSHDEIHVVDVATGADRVIYDGPTLYIPLTFAAHSIYLVHAINIRQGAFERLYTLDPAGGGTPQLVAGSDRHMYQWGWVLISDGAAWGIDNRVLGSDYIYSILRLDLATGQVTKWFESPLGDFSWPLGVDLKSRLYVQGVSQGELWRVAEGSQPVQLPNPGPISLADYVGGPTALVADSLGVWLAGPDGLWLYPEDGAPKHYVVGPSGAAPAGPCL